MARLLYAFAFALSRLPWPWLRRLADGMAALWIRRDKRESRVARRNLELAYPQLLPAQRETLHRDILRTTTRQTLETLSLWTHPRDRNLRLIREHEGVALFDAAIAAGRGVIVAAPHYGNWELLNQWLASRTPLAILYRPPESAVGEAFLRMVRADDEDRVTQVRAEGPGIRQLLQAAQGRRRGRHPAGPATEGRRWRIRAILRRRALTMTLVGRLAERTGATVLFAYCERSGADLRFALRFEAAPIGDRRPDSRIAVAALNDAVERIARRDPAQYQWTYKRYTAATARAAGVTIPIATWSTSE